MSAATFSLLLTNMAVMYAPKLLGSSQPSVDLGSCGSCSLFDFCTLGGGLTIGIIWFIFRHSSWSWVLQDLMGFAFCVTIPSQLKVTNLRTVSILFAAFFAYDVFMVFGTRLITSNGDSVMVEVATEGFILFEIWKTHILRVFCVFGRFLYFFWRFLAFYRVLHPFSRSKS